MTKIGVRIKALREQQNLSQGQLQQKTGLLRVYTSRVENGHVVPASETLEKFAIALGVPLYQFFYEGNDNLPAVVPAEPKNTFGASAKDARYLERLRQSLSKMAPRDRDILLSVANKMALKKSRQK